MERIPVVLDPKNDEVDYDDIILEVDENGIERMMFQMPWADDHKMFCRCPMHGEWKEFNQAVFNILQKLSLAADALDIPELVKDPTKDAESYLIFKKSFSDFYTLSAEILHAKISLSTDIENVFWKYMRPKIDGVDDPRDWFNKNAPVTSSVRFLVAMLNIENILKKNAESILKKAFPKWTSPLSEAGSKQKSDGQTKTLGNVQKSGFA